VPPISVTVIGFAALGITFPLASSTTTDTVGASVDPCVTVVGSPTNASCAGTGATDVKVAMDTGLLRAPSYATACSATEEDTTSGPEYTVEVALGVLPSIV
jgi:hypothetical protein